MSFLRRLKPYPKCIVCGEDAPTGSDRCLRHSNSNANANTSQNPDRPWRCEICGDPVVPRTNRCSRHQSQSQQSQHPSPSTRQTPRSIGGQAERVKISFGDAILLGAGFMLGAFLISIPIFIVFVMALPSIVDLIFEVFREANRS